MDSTATSAIDFARILCFMLAISGGLIAAARYWRRQRPNMSAPSPAHLQEKGPPPGIVYRDAPTVRVTDSQRVDRLRKITRVRVGEHLDVLETKLNTVPRFRITLKALTRHHELDAAHISVEFGGTAVSCGPLVQETSFNEFILPRAVRDEPRSSVFHYHEKGSTLDFMRIKLRSVDVDAETAEIDVMQVSGNWPAG